MRRLRSFAHLSKFFGTRIVVFLVVSTLILWNTQRNVSERCAKNILHAWSVASASVLPAATDQFYQVGDSKNSYIYSAMYDDRYGPTGRSIRLFGMQNRLLSDQIRCRLLLANSSVLELPRETSYPIFKKWPSDQLLYHAYYYGCEVPEHLEMCKNITLSVYLEDEPASATVLPLHVPEPASSGHVYQETVEGNALDGTRSRDIVICVKAIWGDVNATRLVEWFEFQRLLGIRKIVMYDTTTLGSAVRVLDYYRKSGLLELVSFDYALKMYRILQDDPHRDQLADRDMLLEQTYLVSINDCYYRFHRQHDYVMIIDFDEIIVPVQQEHSLGEMISEAEKREQLNVSAYLFQTAWHLEEFGLTDKPNVPAYLHMQKYTRRSPVMQSQPKAIVSSQGAISVNWHGAVTMPTGYGLQGNQYISWQRYGYVHHYRSRCKYDSPKCAVLAQMVEDDEIVPRYSSQLAPLVQGVLKRLDIV